MLHKIPSQRTGERDSPAGLEEAVMMRAAYGEGHVAGNCGWPLGAEGSLQLTGNRKLRASALQPQRPEFCQQYVSLEEDSKLQMRLQCQLMP